MKQPMMYKRKLSKLLAYGILLLLMFLINVVVISFISYEKDLKYNELKVKYDKLLSEEVTETRTPTVCEVVKKLIDEKNLSVYHTRGNFLIPVNECMDRETLIDMIKVSKGL